MPADNRKTKTELIREIHALRRRVQALEDVPANKQAGEGPAFSVLDVRNIPDTLRLVLDISPIGVTFVDADGNLCFANRRAQEVLGVGGTAVEERSFDDPQWKITAVDGGPFPRDDLPFTIVKKTGEPVFGIEHAIEWLDGRRVLLSINAAPVFTTQGAFDGMVVTLEDITVRKQAEEHIRNLSSFPMQNPAPVLRVDTGGGILFANKACEDLSGIAPLRQGGELPAFMLAEVRAAFADHASRMLEIADQERTYAFTIVSLPEGGYANLYGFDITQRRRMEKALQRTNMRLIEAQRIGRIGDWDWEADTDKVTWSENMYHIMGLDSDLAPPEYQGQLGLYHPDDARKLDQAVALALREGVPYDLELRRTRPDGTDLVVQARGEPKRDVSGAIVGLYGSLQDITDFKRTQEALQASEALLRETGRMARVGGWELDTRTQEVRWTEETYAIHEVPVGEKPSLEEAIEFFHPDDRPVLSASIEKALAHGIPYDLEVRFITAKGRELWTRSICRPEMTDGRVVRLMGVFQDITDRKRAELELAEREELLAETSAIVRLGGWEHDLVTRRATWTRQLYEIIELENDSEPPGPDEYLDFYPSGHREILEEAMERAVCQGESFDLELQCRTAKGRLFWARVKGYPIFNGGKCVRVRGVFQDITKHKEIERKLEAAMHAAQDASRAKSEFLANMSHEIRTPLNGVLGMLQLLQLSSLDDEQGRWVTMASDSGNALLDLLNDLLDLSRIEAGVLEFESTAFDMRVLLETLSKAFELSTSDKGIGLTMDIDDTLPGRVEGDAPKLRQVLHNLVGNAIKFTESGEVRIGVHLLPHAPEGMVRILFMVEDTGIGIPEDKLDYIFEPFAQVDGSLARHFKGAGLGLRIASRLVRHLGGGLSVASEEGKGSTFAFSLPFVLPVEESARLGEMEGDEAADKDLRLRILLAEDDPTNREAIWGLLKQHGHDVVCAWDGQQALEMMEREHFDCVVMDISMPVMDGLEAMRAIREDSSRRGHGKVPIVALTAHALDDARQAALAAGADAYLAKPVEWKALAREIETLCYGSDDA